MIKFFPDNKEVPKELIFDNIKIRQLRSIPKEENLEQISKHERDHNSKIEFAFTILDKNETVCFGCLFVKPISPFLKFAFFNERLCNDLALKEDDPGINFWITQSGWKQFGIILEKLIEWFKNDWSHENLFYLGMMPSQEEISAIEKISLKQKFLLQLDNEQYYLWQLF